MSGEPRFSREAFNRELAGLCEAIKGTDASVPRTAAELYELERLVNKYPHHARQYIAQLPPPAAAPP